MIKREKINIFLSFILYYLIMNKEIKENLTGLMITLGTDTERKFAWCLRKINNRPFICIHNSKLEYHKDSANCSIFYISINKIITKWLINNICYYIHINRTKNAHLRIYK